MGHKKIISIREILVVMWLYNSSPSVRTTGQPGQHEMSHFLASVVACTVILYIHFMVNRQLSKQNIHWPVSHDRITGSGVYPLRLYVFADNHFSSDCSPNSYLNWKTVLFQLQVLITLKPTVSKKKCLWARGCTTGLSFCSFWFQLDFRHNQLASLQAVAI